MFGLSERLVHKRQVLYAAIGQHPPLQAEESTPTAKSAREHEALGRSYLRADKVLLAYEEFEAALALDPAGRWCNYYFGLCAYRLGRFEESVSAFSVCIGTTPQNSDVYQRRGLALSALGRHAQAQRDFECAKQLATLFGDRASPPSLASSSLGDIVGADAMGRAGVK